MVKTHILGDYDRTSYKVDFIDYKKNNVQTVFNVKPNDLTATKAKDWDKMVITIFYSNGGSAVQAIHRR